MNIPRVMRFLMVGGVGLTVGYAVLYALTDGLGVWYLFSAIIAFFACYSCNFALHRTWTFQSQSPHVKRQMVRYTCLVTTFFLLNTGLMYVLVDHVHLHYILAQAVLTVVLTLISFFASRAIFAE